MVTLCGFITYIGLTINTCHVMYYEEMSDSKCLIQYVGRGAIIYPHSCRKIFQ